VMPVAGTRTCLVPAVFGVRTWLLSSTEPSDSPRGPYSRDSRSYAFVPDRRPCATMNRLGGYSAPKVIRSNSLRSGSANVVQRAPGNVTSSSGLAPRPVSRSISLS
jgi:hypothetical protein